MANLLTNASFLDGISAWNTTAGALSADEAVLGAPGRIALVQSAPASVYQDVPVTGGVTCEFGVSTSGVSAVTVQFNNGGSGALKTQGVPTPPAKRGIRSTFQGWYGQFLVPTGATSVRFTAVCTASSSVILKPYVGPVTGLPYQATWDPGLQLNPDIQLAAWPSGLRPFLNDTNPTPVPNAKAFSADTSIPIREDYYSGLHYEFKGSLRVTQVELDLLDQFYTAQRGQFWVLDPFSDRLCAAEWLADGAPTFQADQGVTAMYTVGLHMTVV